MPYALELVLLHLRVLQPGTPAAVLEPVLCLAEGKYKTGLPILKLPNGKEITQSFAMARYAAKHKKKFCSAFHKLPRFLQTLSFQDRTS